VPDRFKPGRGRGPPRSPDVGARPWPDDVPGTPGGQAARRAVYALPPPTQAPAPGATYFRLQGRNAGQVVAAGEVTLSAFQLPTGQVGIIRIAEFDVNGLLGSSTITFRIRVNGSIPPGWEWTPFATAAAFFAKEFSPDYTYIRIEEGAQVEVTAEVFDAGTYDVGADVGGWFYGSELRDGYEAAWMAVL
jgi:hypothetical protein